MRFRWPFHLPCRASADVARLEAEVARIRGHLAATVAAKDVAHAALAAERDSLRRAVAALEAELRAAEDMADRLTDRLAERLALPRYDFGFARPYWETAFVVVGTDRFQAWVGRPPCRATAMQQE